MDKRIYLLRNTLNQIEVKGKENLDLLLGCIIAVENIISEHEAETAKKKEDENEQNQTA